MPSAKSGIRSDNALRGTSLQASARRMLIGRVRKLQRKHCHCHNYGGLTMQSNEQDPSIAEAWAATSIGLFLPSQPDTSHRLALECPNADAQDSRSSVRRLP